MARMLFFVISAVLFSMIFSLIGTSVGITYDDSGVLQGVFGISNFTGDNTATFDYSAGSFFGRLMADNVGILLMALGGAIAVGFFTKSSTENYLVLPFITGVLFLFVGTFWQFTGIANHYDNWIRIPLLLIFVAYTFGYILTSVEFFRGNT